MIDDELKILVADELRRQAENRPEELSVQDAGPRLRVDGEIDVDDLVQTILGALAGGP